MQLHQSHHQNPIYATRSKISLPLTVTVFLYQGHCPNAHIDIIIDTIRQNTYVIIWGFYFYIQLRL